MKSGCPATALGYEKISKKKLSMTCGVMKGVSAKPGETMTST
jgi:hypothetical protein